MIKLVATYALCFCGGYGAGTIIKEGINEKKPWQIVIGLILAPLTVIGAGYAGMHAFDEIEENEENKEA